MQGTSWARGLELIGDDERLVAHAGVLPPRLLAEQLGLTRELSAGMRRRGFEPVYDRGQVLLDLALTLIDGGQAISDFQALAHLAPVIGPVPPAPAVWRTLNEIGDLQLARVNAAVTEFRRHWWGLLAGQPEGFPWLKAAAKELTGITVPGLDASVVFCGSEKENAKATYKGGTGFCPNLAACDNTGDMLAIDPRPGNSASNCAAGNIALLDLAVSRLPGPFRHNVLVRLDGAGFSHELLEHIAANGGKRGRHWEFSVGWSCTDVEMDAIARLPEAAWTAGTDQDGDVLDDTHVADLTGLLDLDAWTGKIPGLRILVREEPLHPRYRKRATEREKRLGKSLLIKPLAVAGWAAGGHLPSVWAGLAGFVPGEAFGHDENGCPVDHGLVMLDGALVVAGEATVAHEPAEGALHDPAAFHDLEGVGAGPLDDFEGDAGCLLHPVPQRLPVVAAVGPHASAG